MTPLSANWPPYFIPFSKAKQKKGSVLLYGNMFHFRKTLGIGVVYVKIYGTSCSLSKGKKCEKHNTFQKTQFSKKDFLLFVQLYNWFFHDGYLVQLLFNSFHNQFKA